MTRRPNILWLMADEVRPDALGSYGCTFAKTPNLDRLAATSTRFEHAYTQSPLCVPSRAAFFTGTHCRTLGVCQNDMRLNFESWHSDRLNAAIERSPEDWERRVQSRMEI